MGELIKTYGKVNINGKEYEVELNAPIEGDAGGIVHIQNKKSRIEMSQADFYQMVTLLNLAKKNLEIMKGDIDE